MLREVAKLKPSDDFICLGNLIYIETNTVMCCLQDELNDETGNEYMTIYD